MATSFPSFPLLPKELRLAIWNLALEPRIVELCFDVLDQADEGAGSGNEEEVEGEDQYEEPRNEQDGPFVVKEDNAVEENENEDEDEEQAKEKSEVKDDSHVEIDTRDVKDDGDDENADVEEGRNSNRRHEDVSLDVANHDRDTAIDDVDNISETSEHTYSRALGSGQFYSPSPLPSLLRVNSEARSAALAAALNGLPVASNQEDVYYNPEIDILYFPAGCWQEDIMGFEQAISEEVKESIRRIALGESESSSKSSPDFLSSVFQSTGYIQFPSYCFCS
ncbi:hypothetical protein DL98DRAFT_516667 [Cadophora sp. DSE1049]|nr:hypothetical protein DL98DRAFT_516667 [Cadophora sp. DSE1049]